MEKINRYNLEIINNISSDRKKLVIENKIEPQLSDRGEWVRWVDIENKLKLLYNPLEPKLEWEPNPSEQLMTWFGAANYCGEKFNDGWRLPTISELKEAYDNKVEGFKSFWYWSSTTLSFDKNYARSLNFGDPPDSIYWKWKTDTYYVRCVREVEK